MNIESKINVHQSSLVGLKAELLRKKSEVEAAKANQKNEQYLDKKKEKIVKKSIKEQKREEKWEKKEEREKRDEDPETMRAHKKSQLMLQAKSRLYSKLSKTHTTINPNFLVDFENKPDVSDSDDEEKRKDDDYRRKSDYDDDSDGEWVEYTDCFGRSRKCLREDLPKMQKNDEQLRNTIAEAPRENSKEQIQFVEDREPMKEPAIEVMRRKWEEQMAKLADKADIHYQDVLFDEARSHGVGYYAFSQDEEERAKQQESLLKLRKETERKQQENQKIMEMKEKIQQNRLKAARIRQRLRAGLPPEDPEDEKTENKEESQIPGSINQDLLKESVIKKENVEDDENNKNVNTEENKQESNRKKLEDIDNKVKAFGEMLGKRNRWYIMSQDEWVQKKRKERINEFAPAYANFKPGEILNISETTKDLINSNDYSNEDMDVIGPMPSFQEKFNTEGLKTSFSTEEDFIGPIPPSLNKDFIGPVPQPTTVDLNYIREIPPPSISKDFISRVPLPSEDCISPVSPSFQDDLQSSKDSTICNTNVEDQIAAGLKFLRQQFESKNKKY